MMRVTFFFFFLPEGCLHSVETGGLPNKLDGVPRRGPLDGAAALHLHPDLVAEVVRDLDDVPHAAPGLAPVPGAEAQLVSVHQLQVGVLVVEEGDVLLVQAHVPPDGHVLLRGRLEEIIST